MSDWLDRVGNHTSDHRERRARCFAAKACRRRARVRLAGGTDREAEEAGWWHASREKGQRERIERVEACSTEVISVSCPACGTVHELPKRCSCRLLCVRCRGAKARETRTRFGRSRAAILGEALQRGLLNPNRRHGAFGERFLTLTGPHFPEDDIEGRIVRLLEAWKWFVRQFQTWRRQRDLQTVEFFRVLEWTPGTDKKGHPHLHVWIFSPYLEREMLVDWWREGLERVMGKALDQDPIVDIRRVDDDIGQELIKYLTKDIDEQGEKIAPELYAQIYCALDQRRTFQSSRGFMARGGRQRACRHCGSTLPPDVRVARPSHGGLQ